ncbi:hypothetical protein KFE25_005885 [Diacronema lutheri]|uniref:Cytochrome P450 n=2 Tax=Diacronema lutheri TaxID=2081491 RepID=A0A8J6CGS3_DIALT|nr:hypothetical protein KFE25_005885 [Diacronema lutheri]
MPASAAGLIAIPAAAAAAYFVYRVLRPAAPPLPPKAPSSMLETVAAMTSPNSIEFLTACAERVGPIFRLPMPLLRPLIVVVEPKVARAVLDNPSHSKPLFMYAASESVAGNVSTIFSARDHSAGSKWQWARKATAKAFHPSHVHAMNVSCAECYTRWMDETLAPAAANGHPLKMCDELLLTTIQFICDAAFGYQLARDEAEAVLHDTQVALEVSFRVFALVPFSETFWWAFAKGRAHRVASRRLLAFSAKMLEAYRSLPDGRKAQMNGTLIAIIDGNAKYGSDAERVAEILMFLIAGHDTTALAVAWVLSDLAHHAHDQAELRAELHAMPPAERSKSALLAAVIKESMRLNPVAAGGSVRQLEQALPLPGGKAVLPEGAIVVVPFGVLFRRPHIGDAPNEFRPRRWLAGGPDADRLADVHPFSLGRRNCVGQALALAELHTVVPMLLAEYEWEVVQSPRAELFLTNKPEGLMLRAKRVTRTS